MNKEFWVFFKKLFLRDVKFNFFPWLKIIIGLALIAGTIFFIIMIGLVFSEEVPVRPHDPTNEVFEYEFIDYDPDDDSSSYQSSYQDEDEEKERGRAEGATDDVFSVFIIFFFLIFIVLAVIHLHNFSRESINGNLRSFSLYPYTIRTIITAKMFNNLIFTFVLTMIFMVAVFVYMAFLEPGILGMLWVLGLFLINFAFYAILYVFSFAIYLMIKKYKPKLKMDPIVIMMLVMGYSIMTTESFICGTFYMFRSMNNMSYHRPFYADLMIFSPLHALGRVIDLFLGYEIGGFHGGIPYLIMIGVATVAWLIAQKIYPDYLIKETA